MAKFVQVGYGHDGRGVGDKVGGYTYIVNDGVRAGDLIVPIPAYNTFAGRDINTMAKVISTTKSLDRKATKDVTVPDKSGSGDNNLTYTNEDIKNELETNGLVALNEDGKVEDTSGIRDISNDGYKPLRSYGNQEKLKQQIGERQKVVQEKNAKSKEVADAFKGETYDSYVASWEAKQGKGEQ